MIPREDKTVREFVQRGGRFDEDLTAPEDELHAGPAERFRRTLPAAAAQVTQLVVDNPAQFALVIAGTVVTARAAFNIVRPRTPLEGLALMVVLQVGLPALATAAIDRGWLKFRVRDEDGNLIPLAPGDVPLAL